MKRLDLNDGLSIVMPTFNEGIELTISINAALAALKQCDFPFEIVAVDDGSDDTHPELEQMLNVKYIRKEHSGRIETIVRGIELAKFNNVLVLGARVRLRADSLVNLSKLIESHSNARFWNGMVYLLRTDLPHVSIWETLIKVGWNRGLSSNGVQNYGLKDFDLYPKGSGLFLAAKNDWLDGFHQLNQYALTSKVVISDDTRLIRRFAELSNIWFSKDFAADYKPRTNFKLFLKNGFHRGTTFVDSYWDSQTIFGKLVRWSLPIAISLIVGSFLVGGIKGIAVTALLTLALALAAFFIYCLKSWRSPWRAIKESIVLIPLLMCFGAAFSKAYVFGFQSRRSLLG